MSRELGEGSTETRVKVYGPSSHETPTGVDPDDWSESDHVSGYVRGPLGHRHFLFPARFRWDWSASGPMDLVAVSVTEANASITFRALYNRNDRYYAVERMSDDRIRGDTYDEDLDHFVEIHDQVLWTRGDDS